MTHLPLLILWVYAALGAFERASTVVKYLQRVFVTPNDADGGDGDDHDDEDDSNFAYPESKRLVGSASRSQSRSRALPEQLPYVCVQLPMYNEAAVACRAIDAACLLRWPRDLLEIQVRLTHPSHIPYTFLAHLTHPSYNPQSPLTHISHTPHKPLSHPSYTPQTPLRSWTTPRTRPGGLWTLRHPAGESVG